eukprot:gnl/MRDRNA2_/MRDRNA2_14505_c0_seq1.p1 gnl/MRDRNA2_/MRDRNA2_14505_c0~~gnl/MRDRNA2_/MRDRNA2_14505_c0_seq1.p1  ORF type:complete len:441 (-),score=90.34 gnl/MRDRNA2_/MRDRNA2_14505_c0_seq1:59-1381(-)
MNFVLLRRGPWCLYRAICIQCLAELWLFLSAQSEEVELPPDPRVRRQFCERRFRESDFAADNFQGPAMQKKNLTIFVQCLYQLRTSLRPSRKEVLAGGIHYPTLLVVNHKTPPVSASGARYCWLDQLGWKKNGLNPKNCCDSKHGPRGMEACFDDHFSYELCCLGELNRGEMPHHFIGPALDLNVANTVRQLGTFDISQSYGLQTLCREGDIVIDVGANIGGFTVPLAERVGHEGEVHAFEPFRKVFQHLTANVALNGLSNVYTHNVALGVENRVDEVYVPDLRQFNFPSAMRVTEQESIKDAEAQNVKYEEKKEKVQVRPLDSFEFDRRVSLVKIDVEFMEMDVVLGGLQTFRKHQPVLWVENEPYFDDPPNLRFVEMMEKELEYVCTPVAKLELLCQPKKNGGRLPKGFKRVLKHLHGEVKDMNLWSALKDSGDTEYS